MIGLVGMCQYGMRQTAEVENQMTSVSTAIDSSVGLAITQMIGLVGMCQYGMRQTAEVENQMTSRGTSHNSDDRTRRHVPVWDETDRRGGESGDICKYSYRLVRYCSVGLAITQVIGLVGMCQYGIRQTAEVENQMTSVSTAIDSLDTVAWD
ncbi:putative ATP-dependent bile acid permease [Operophtera brumata]|uniref:Putative ATP-dependent bile acid permease n=1 Tax=Operophtera brumata TaxID=104452 RepID=A0A0L7L5X0_OPEBR|nr:putative ATP-dependent bile acid permease [Operophtera brumata]